MGTLIIPNEIHNEIMFYINECSTEVSGMGRVTITPNGDFLVNKIYLLSQEVGAAHTDIDAEAIARLMFETIDDTGDLLYWWHSHVNMQAFWSGTDLATIKTMGGNGLCVASVFNKKGESRHASCYKSTITYSGYEELILHENIPHTIGTPATDEQLAHWKNELKTKLRPRTVASYGYATGYSTELTSHLDKKLDAYNEGRYGILGYGADVEARALQMSDAEYLKVIEGNDAKAYKRLEKNLETLWEQGYFTKNESWGLYE